jgi:hypothetical protein
MSLKTLFRASLAGAALLGLTGQASEPAAASPQAPAPSASPTTAPAASPGKDPLLEFVPREHVPADSAVSFPVDI